MCVCLPFPWPYLWTDIKPTPHDLGMITKLMKIIPCMYNSLQEGVFIVCLPMWIISRDVNFAKHMTSRMAE